MPSERHDVGQSQRIDAVFSCGRVVERDTFAARELASSEARSRRRSPPDQQCAVLAALSRSG